MLSTALYSKQFFPKHFGHTTCHVLFYPLPRGSEAASEFPLALGKPSGALRPGGGGVPVESLMFQNRQRRLAGFRLCGMQIVLGLGMEI